MPIEARPLPCDPTAFSPQLSPEQVGQHRRHQQARLDAVNAALGDDEAQDPATLDGIARSARGALAADAALAWSDDFYWSGLRPPQPGGDNSPGGALADAIAQAFGDFARFRERFGAAALQLAGTGAVWLVQRRDGRLAILATPRATTPLTGDDAPLLVCSLWPHAYALDYGDARERYLAAFWHLVDWKAVAARLRAQPGADKR